jgi:hypothetical protein
MTFAHTIATTQRRASRARYLLSRGTRPTSVQPSRVFLVESVDSRAVSTRKEAEQTSRRSLCTLHFLFVFLLLRLVGLGRLPVRLSLSFPLFFDRKCSLFDWCDKCLCSLCLPQCNRFCLLFAGNLVQRNRVRESLCWQSLPSFFSAQSHERSFRGLSGNTRPTQVVGPPIKCEVQRSD